MAESKGSRTSRILARLARERELMGVDPESDRLSLSLVTASLARQKTYLSWTLFSMLLQLAEMAILAGVHYVFFPPVSLELLRFLSAISILSLLSSYWIREMLDDENLNKSEEVISIAKLMFFGTLTLALLLTILLQLRTNIAVTTPPIYRSLLLSSLVAMPFDALTCFIFYNLKFFPTTWRPRWLRSFAVAINTLALVALIRDFPFAYFLLKLTPRIFIVALLWVKCAKRPFRELFSLESLAHPKLKQALIRRLREICPAALFFLVSESVFLYAYRPLARFDSNFAVILFVAHKLAHILSVLSIKVRMALLRDWQFAKATAGKVEKQRVLKRSVLLNLIYFAATLLFTPFIFLKLNIAFWISPTGEMLRLDLGLCLLAVFLIVCRGYLTGAIALLMGQERKGKLPWVAMLALLSTLACGWLLLPHLLTYFDALDIFVGLMFLDALVCLSIALGIERKSYLRAFRKITAFKTLAELLADFPLANTKDALQTVAIRLEFHPSVVMDENEVMKLFNEFPDKPFVAMLGLREYLLLFRFQTEQPLTSWKRELLLKQGAIIRALDVQRIERPDEFLKFLRKPSQGDQPTEERQSAKRKLAAFKAKGVSAFGSGALLLSAQNGWKFPKGTPWALQLYIKRFLLRLFAEGEFIRPTLYGRRSGRGILHFNESGRPHTLVFIPPEERGLIDALRREIFEDNLTDYLRGVNK